MGHKYRYRPGQMVPGTGLKIIRPLGSGGMGAVYEVEETSVEAPFVMKVVQPGLRPRLLAHPLRAFAARQQRRGADAPRGEDASQAAPQKHRARVSGRCNG